MRTEVPTSGVRCPWAATPGPEQEYHDDEWGVPSHDDRHLFELLVLEGAQAGLSWSTILAKREHYRAVLDGFDPEQIWLQLDMASVPALKRARRQLRAIG